MTNKTEDRKGVPTPEEGADILEEREKRQADLLAASTPDPEKAEKVVEVDTWGDPIPPPNPIMTGESAAILAERRAKDAEKENDAAAKKADAKADKK